MNPPLALDQDEALVGELYRLEIRHLSRLATYPPAGSIPPEKLLAALAAHPQARFQASLILVFLRHPELSAALPAALEHLETPAINTLKLYYQAAAYLQRELELELRGRLENWQLLPDLFSAQLGLPSAASIRPEPRGSQDALRALGEAHRQLSGWAFNWTESYRHYVPFFLRHLPSTYGHLDTRTTYKFLDGAGAPLP